MDSVRDTIDRVLGGDREAYRAIVSQFGPSIRAMLAGQLSDSSAVDDLAQETFIAAYEGLRTFQPDGDFELWLKGICRNRLMMYLRRIYQHGKALDRIKAQILQEALADTCRLQEPDGSATLEKLRDCLDKLPERVRDVLQARYFERQRVTTIAGRLRTSVMAISSLLFRGRKMLAGCIDGGREA